ncbi:MAG: class I SAM-dependent methyltransferase [Armatimonadota bacterium]
MFLLIMHPTEITRILDVGFSDKEYGPSDNFLEKHYPYKENIIALGIDEPREFKARYPQVEAIRYDGKTFPFEDKSFDICWSNAVIEHVGSTDDQIFFLKEIERTSNTAFITTPNRFFPIEVHTRVLLLHYLPKHIFDAFLKLIGKRWAMGRYMNLLSLRQIHKLMRLAGISNYRIIANKLYGITLDFVIIIGD